MYKRQALHLSPKEELQIESIAENINLEYLNNQDAFSKDIIIAHLDTLLKYAKRFYERQFIHRKELNNNLLNQLEVYLTNYFSSNNIQEKGLPNIEEIANSMSVSQRYLSDSLKKETGKTTTEHIHLFLIDQAKEMLLQPHKTVAEVAYELGFEYPPYCLLYTSDAADD